MFVILLTLFRVRRHLLHESYEVEQELCVVVGQLQIVAVLPEEQTSNQRQNREPVHVFTPSVLQGNTNTEGKHETMRVSNTCQSKHNVEQL